MVSNPPPGSNGPYTALPSSANGAGAAGIMPSAGHYADMQTLMQNLEALSGWLQQNREDSEWLTQNVRRVEHLPVSRLGHSTEAHPENSVESEDEAAHTIVSLQTELQQSRQRISQLQASISSFQSLQTLCTTTLTETMRLVRNYTYSQQSHLTHLHQHYTRLLQDARYENLEGQTAHQKWQESLTHISQYLREASVAREEEAAQGGLLAEVRGLRYENRFLRRKVGWDRRDFTELEQWEIEADKQDEDLKKNREKQKESLAMREGSVVS